VLFVDARAPDEYLGRGGNTRRLGHIPGAVNLPAGRLAEPGSQRLPSIETLRLLVREAGIGRSRRIVCYDGSGLAATKVAFVLAVLGFDDVAVYDGGWAEWGDRLDLPVER
jgi:thiosulfate/3-mercaptopyruvate sulfurtransferase